MSRRSTKRRDGVISRSPSGTKLTADSVVIIFFLEQCYVRLDSRSLCQIIKLICSKMECNLTANMANVFALSIEMRTQLEVYVIAVCSTALCTALTATISKLTM